MATENKRKKQQKHNNMKTMKRTIVVLVALVAFSMASVAQSCDAAYPFWGWVNELPDTGDAPYWVEIDVNRVTKPDEDFGGRKGCGYISVTDSNNGKEIYKGQLNYAGKGLNADGTSTGIYYFDVRTKDGRTAKLGIKRTTDGVVTTLVSGQVPGSSEFHNKALTQLPFNGTWVPVGVESTTEKELLDDLRDALTDYDKDRTEYRTKGFGNVKQYIAAHANLDPAKPKYAKPKGAGAVNIRATASTTAQKVADLQPGHTLLVVDEYDGWCQVKLADKKFGWVSLSVVTLTNTPGQAMATTATQETFPPVVNGHLAFMGIPMNVSPALMKSKLMAMGMTPAKDKWSEGEDFWLEGMVNGVKTQVWVSVDGNHKIYNINTYDAKSYKLAQAQARYKKLLDSMVATYGKGAYQTNENGFKEYYIRSDKGVINVQLFNEDEMEGASINHKVAVYYSEHTD